MQTVIWKLLSRKKKQKNKLRNTVVKQIKEHSKKNLIEKRLWGILEFAMDQNMRQYLSIKFISDNEFSSKAKWLGFILFLHFALKLQLSIIEFGKKLKL